MHAMKRGNEHLLGCGNLIFGRLARLVELSAVDDFNPQSRLFLLGGGEEFTLFSEQFFHLLKGNRAL